jgi:uncharacterized protein YndB with AHSA1/START domain
MTEIRGTTYFERPVEVVFDFLTDPRNEPKYNPLILAARKTTSGPIGLGTRYVQQVKSFGRVGDVDIEIVEYQRLGHLAFDICSAGMQVRGDLLLAAEGSGTRVVWHWRLKPRGALRILAPLVGVAGRRLERRVWIQMKHYLDARLDARVTTA